MSENATFYTVRTLSELMGVSESLVYRQVEKRAWPHRRVGSRIVRFSAQDVTDILDLMKVVPAVAPLMPQGRRRKVRH